MALSNIRPVVHYMIDSLPYVGNHPVPFQVPSFSDLEVLLNGQLLEASQYTHTPDSNGNSGGTVSVTTAVPIDSFVTIRRSTASVRATDYTTAGIPTAAVLNAEADRLVAASQEEKEARKRTIRQPVVDLVSISPLPNAGDRASKVLAFDAEGQPVAMTSTSLAGDVSSAQLTAESNARQAADTALGERIDTEENVRQSADITLGQSIGSEITDRTAADTALGVRIDNNENLFYFTRQLAGPGVASDATNIEQFSETVILPSDLAGLHNDYDFFTSGANVIFTLPTGDYGARVDGVGEYNSTATVQWRADSNAQWADLPNTIHIQGYKFASNPDPQNLSALISTNALPIAAKQVRLKYTWTGSGTAEIDWGEGTLRVITDINNQVHSGVVVPDNIDDGEDGDLYIRTTDPTELYHKRNGAWVEIQLGEDIPYLTAQQFASVLEGNDLTPDEGVIRPSQARDIRAAGRVLLAAWRGEVGNPTSASNDASLPVASFINNAVWEAAESAVNLAPGTSSANYGITWDNDVIDFDRSSISVRISGSNPGNFICFLGGSEPPSTTPSVGVWGRALGLGIGLNVPQSSASNCFMYAFIGDDSGVSYISSASSKLAAIGGSHDFNLGLTRSEFATGTHVLRGDVWVDTVRLFFDNEFIAEFPIVETANRRTNIGGHFGCLFEKFSSSESAYIHDIAVEQATLESAEGSLAPQKVQDAEWRETTKILQLKLTGNREKAVPLTGLAEATAVAPEAAAYAIPSAWQRIRDDSTGAALASVPLALTLPAINTTIPTSDLTVDQYGYIRAQRSVNLNVRLAGRLRGEDSGNTPSGSSQTPVAAQALVKILRINTDLSSTVLNATLVEGPAADNYEGDFSITLDTPLLVGQSLRVYLEANGSSGASGVYSELVRLNDTTIELSDFGEHVDYDSQASNQPLTLITNPVTLPTTADSLTIPLPNPINKADRQNIDLQMSNPDLDSSLLTINLLHQATLIHGTEITQANTGRNNSVTNSHLPVMLLWPNEVLQKYYWPSAHAVPRAWTIVFHHSPSNSNIITHMTFSWVRGYNIGAVIQRMVASR